MDNKIKPDCVVVDTNIWRSEFLLKSPIGASVVYTLGRQQGFIGLPEVVEGELTRNILEIGKKERQKLEHAARVFSTLMGYELPTLTPSDADLENKVHERLHELDRILRRVPFTFEHAKTALEMVNAKIAPNERNQQFKDSAIWQAVLDLSSEFCVHFVTADKAFLLCLDDVGKGLAKNLQQDCDDRNVRVFIYGDLGSCVKAIRNDAPAFDRQAFFSLLLPAIAETARMRAIRHGIAIEDVIDTKIEAFQINNDHRLAVDYWITWQGKRDSSSQLDRVEEIGVIVQGCCYYEGLTASLSELFVQAVLIKSRFGSGGRSVQAWSPKDDVPSAFRRPIIWD